MHDPSVFLLPVDIGEDIENAESSADKEGGEEGGKAEKTALEKFEVAFCSQLGPVVVRVLHRLLRCAHLYVSPAQCGLGADTSEQVPPAMREAVETLLSLSGRNPISPKECTALSSQLPMPVQDRLRSWESALPLDPTLKKKLSVYGDIQLEACLHGFLDCHFLAFAGLRTFDPSRGLKSAVSSGLVVLEYMFGVFHEMEGEGDETKKAVSEAVVSLSCDLTMEFSQAQLLKFLLDTTEFASRCLQYKTAMYVLWVRVFHRVRMHTCELNTVVERGGGGGV